MLPQSVHVGMYGMYVGLRGVITSQLCGLCIYHNGTRPLWVPVLLKLFHLEAATTRCIAGLSAKRRLLISGTPIQNSISSEVNLRVDSNPHGSKVPKSGVYMVSILGIVTLVLGIYAAFGYLDPQGMYFTRSRRPPTNRVAVKELQLKSP